MHILTTVTLPYVPGSITVCPMVWKIKTNCDKKTGIVQISSRNQIRKGSTEMNRREFIKGSLVTAAVISSGTADAGQYTQAASQRIMKLANRANPSVLEQKHVPAIEAPKSVSSGAWFVVTVRVGFLQEHPSTKGHWITMIKLLVNNSEAAVSRFNAGGVSSSSATFRIRLDRTSTLEAVEHCNLHGTWISDPVPVSVA